MAKHGWNVLVTNHRGMGGVSFTVSKFQFLVTNIYHYAHQAKDIEICTQYSFQFSVFVGR